MQRAGRDSTVTIQWQYGVQGLSVAGLCYCRDQHWNYESLCAPRVITVFYILVNLDKPSSCILFASGSRVVSPHTLPVESRSKQNTAADKAISILGFANGWS